jgi:DNA polymerase III alpha subunit
LTFQNIHSLYLQFTQDLNYVMVQDCMKIGVKKAKFLGIDTLGIAEQNTLAGTLAFQEDCKKKEIKSIIGETITVLAEDKSKFHIKLYVQNEEGWKNLLWINKVINVDNGGEYIGIGELLDNVKLNGLICVLSPEVNLK